MSQCGQFSVVASQSFRDEVWINHLPCGQPNVANSACSSAYQHGVANHFEEANQKKNSQKFIN
jgi:hypothetical protein